MTHLAYVGVLLVVVLASGWLEPVYGLRVWRRPLRLFLTLLPVVVFFLSWDAYAISRDQWSFDPARVIGVYVWHLPLEELLFFVVVPVASVLTFEAVRRFDGSR